MQAEERKRLLAGRGKIPPAAFWHRLPIREAWNVSREHAASGSATRGERRTKGTGLLCILRAILTPTRHASWSRRMPQQSSVSAACW